MSAPILLSFRRNLVLFAAAFAVASAAFGTVMLSSPPISEAAVSPVPDDGRALPITHCESLPLGDVDLCTVYR